MHIFCQYSNGSSHWTHGWRRHKYAISSSSWKKYTFRLLGDSGFVNIASHLNDITERKLVKTRSENRQTVISDILKNVSLRFLSSSCLEYCFLVLRYSYVHAQVHVTRAIYICMHIIYTMLHYRPKLIFTWLCAVHVI